MDTASYGSNDRRQRVLLQMPEDFLRIPLPPGAAEETSRPRSQSQETGTTPYPAAGRRPVAVQQGKLSVTIAQAKLGKNYGLTRMDPYARIRIGHYVFETETDTNGATNPRWDKTFTCFVPPGINNIYVEIFDERTFGQDERIAWGHITIPQRVMDGDTLDDWFPLSGKQGEQKEGMIELVFTYQLVTHQAPAPIATVPYCLPGNVMLLSNPAMPAPYTTVQMTPRVVYPGQMPEQMVLQNSILPVQITDDDIKQLKEMFPNIDDEVIRSVLEEKHGHKQAAINALLSMTEA